MHFKPMKKPRPKNHRKPINFGRIALKRQAGANTLAPTGILTTELPIQNLMH